MWGDDPIITLTQSALGLTGSYSTNATKTVSDVDFTHTDLMKNNSDIQVKASSGVIYNSTLVPGKIKKVQITHSGTARSTTIAMGTSTSSYTSGSYTGNGSIYLNGPANTCCGYFKITRGSNAAYWTKVEITYTPATITLSESNITGLNYNEGSGTSAAKTFNVSGSNIPANLIVTAPTNFEVSLNGSSWASTQTINVTLTGSATAGTLSSTPVYVRLASGKSAGNYNGNVSIAMAGCNTITNVNPKTVAVSGTVSAAAGPTLTTSSSMTTLTYSNGSPVAQSFTIGGSNLTSTVTVSAPTNYEVCKTADGEYASSVSFTNTEVNAADKTVYVRLQSGLSAGNIASSDITVASSGADSKTIAVTGSVPYTITWMANGSTHATTYVAVGGTLALPATDPVPGSCGCNGKAFYGWYGGGTSYEHATTAPSIAAAGNAVNADKTYYAVFATDAGESTEDEWVETAISSLTSSDVFVLSDGSYAFTNDNGTSSAPSAVAITVASSKITSTVNANMKWNISGNGTDGYVFYPNGLTTTWLYCSTNASSGTNNNIRVGTGDRKYFVLDEAGDLVTNDTYADRYLRNYSNSDLRGYVNKDYGTAVAPHCYRFVEGSQSYIDYSTTCCTELGSINGSVSLAQLTTANPTKLKATWTMNAETGIDSYDLEIYDSNDNKVKTIKGYTSGDEITGLTPCTSYYAKLYTVSQGSPYCDGGLISTSTPVSTIGYTYGITKTNVSLKTGADEEANTCVGDFSAQYQATAGYALPTTLTVTGASAHTWSISEGVGTLSIDADDVTGNVTTTIAGTCVPPTITVHPQGNTYAKDATADALTVTASAAGATLGYQWQTSTDNTNWADISEANGGKAATYTPSTASAGTTTYYRVIVSNSVCSCDATQSEAAAIVVSSIPVCATPTFSPDGTTSYNANQTITISCETTDATIYYSTDGNDPTIDSEHLYDPANKPVISASTTIKAIAVKSSYTNSAVGSASYEFKCVAPTITPGTGDVTIGQAITLTCETAGATIYYTMGDNPADPTTASTPYDPDNKPVVSAATTIKAIAVKTGWSNSDVASATYAMKYTVTLNAGTGSVSDASLTQASHGASVSLPTPTLSSSLTAAGWSFSGWKTTSAVTTQTDVKPGYVTTSYAPTSNITLYAVYEKTSGGTTVDEITRATTGMADQTGGSVSYTAWSNKQATSDAKYAGTSAANYNTIQISGTSPRGFVSTVSGGLAKKVTVTWNSNQTTGTKYAVEVYGKNTAYAGSSDLFSSESATQGTQLGSLDAANTGTSELTITGDYAYIGIRAKENALYLTEVDIEWSTASKSYYSNPSDKVTLTYNANGATDGEAPGAQGNITIGTGVTVAAKPEGLAKTGHDFGGWNTKADGTGTNYTAGTDEITMTDNITLYAKWTKHNYTVAVASVDHTTITATPEGGSAIAENANASVAYETVVTLGKTDDTHFTAAWDVYETGNSSNKVSVVEGKFTVPAFDVTVSATFTEAAKRNVKFYSNGAQLGTTQEVYVGEAPVAETAVYESCLEGSNMFYGWTTEEWTGAIDKTALDAKTVETGALPEVGAGEGDVNYYAVWAKGTSTPTTSYAKITSAEDLTTDDYVIAYSYNNGEQIVLKNEEHANPVDGKLAGFSLALSESKYSNPSNAYIWTLQAQNDGSYYIYNAAIEKYVNATTTAATLSATHTKFTLDYNTTDSRWIIKLASNTDYAFHGYVTSSNNTITDRDFRVSTSPISHDNAFKYRIYLYKNEKETSYSEFRTNCCGLKPVTGLTAGTVAATSITLNWNAPESTDGITKLQVVNADNGNVLKDNIDKDATSAVVTGLETCTTYNLKVVSVGDDCSSNSNIVTATPQAEAKTVTFQYNDGVTANVVASTTCEADYVAVPANPTRSGYRFMGWKNGDELVEGETFTPTAASTTINATWAQLFTVHYDFAGATTGVAPDDAQYIAGEEVTLTDVEPSKGFLAPFKAWSFSPSVEVSEGKFAMPAEDVTITATYDEIVGQWILVTDESTLNEGDYVVIAAAGSNKAMKTTQNSTNYRYITDITKSGNTISTPSNDVQIFVLEEGTVADSWAFKCLNGDYKEKYIYANSSGNNTMNTKAGKNNDGSWKLDLEHGYATAQGENTRNILSFNSDRFACYGNTNQSSIAFYQFREGVFYDVTLPEEVTGGAVYANTSMAKAGETVTLTYAPSRGYTVETLTVTGATSGDDIAINPALEAGVTEYTFTMPAEAVTVAASFEAVPPVDYNLVTDAANLAIGVQFLIVGNETNGYRAAATRNGEYLYAISIEDPETNKVSITTEDVVDFVLSDKDGDNWVISSIEGKLSATTGGNISYNGDNDKWGISISEGDATITNGSYKLRYNYNNGTTPRFKTYSNNTGEIPALYALPYTTYDFELSGCKTIKVVTGYTYTYTIKNSDEPSSTPGDNYTFLHKWTDGTNTYAVGDAVEVSATKTLYPCWKVIPTENEIDFDGLPASTVEVLVNEGKNLNINEPDRTIDNLTVEAGGKVSGSETVEVNNLTIKTKLGNVSGDDNTGGKSGEILNPGNITASEVWIEIELTQDAAASAGWYAFSVPFPVDAMNGVYYGSTKLVNEKGYAIMSHHGDLRAENKYAWKKYRDILQPGVFYVITVGNTDYKTLRFKKVDGAAIFNEGNVVSENQMTITSYPSSDTYAANWNGMGNPYLETAQVGSTYLQFYDHGDNVFRQRTGSAVQLMVGSAFFLQSAESTISVTRSDEGSILLAPARTPKAIEETIFEVRLNDENGREADNLFLTAREDATNEYEIGRDVAKMSMGTAKCAQMWVPAYGTQLGAADFQLVNGKAEYPLVINTPKAGTYTMSTVANENADIYLTYEGSIIWNLSMGEYELDLEKGTTNGYGLLLQAKAPQVVTGVDEVDAETGVQKVIIDEHVFILRGGQMYDVTGKMVK